ncbi:hypothetical protein ATCV1_z426L [Acanthocystis turfacea chlorella virus 1]|uniref:Uncharacterized protein z426L n=1 Tax=Chlorovirus heliozoae TaxID=322019 RepID=A7K936_9PHYC|nr:hypothetical protein ATCV1_z426L [Acanthocystis turfacea chlorella virus 1]ABT16560.1 hypothetical protein ATCV1_z426L [Acanthocystis turfacea chlorella virus 1]
MKEMIALLAHWNSCFCASSRLRGPSPYAMAFPAYTPFLPREANIRVVFMSSSSSGPMPPISLRADVRTA